MRYTLEQLQKLARHCRQMAARDLSEWQWWLALAIKLEAKCGSGAKQQTPVGSGRY